MRSEFVLLFLIYIEFLLFLSLFVCLSHSHARSHAFYLSLSFSRLFLRILYKSFAMLYKLVFFFFYF